MCNPLNISFLQTPLLSWHWDCNRLSFSSLIQALWTHQAWHQACLAPSHCQSCCSQFRWSQGFFEWVQGDTCDGHRACRMGCPWAEGCHSMIVSIYLVALLMYFYAVSLSHNWSQPVCQQLCVCPLEWGNCNHMLEKIAKTGNQCSVQNGCSPVQFWSLSQFGNWTFKNYVQHRPSAPLRVRDHPSYICVICHILTSS